MSESIIVPFRSKRKLTYAQQSEVPEDISIPRWDAKKAKQVSLHHVHGVRTWMCDHFFIKGEGEVIQDENINIDDMDENKSKSKNIKVVLCFIHCNSRLVHAYITENKGLNDFFRIIKLYTIKHLPYEPYEEGIPDWIKTKELSLMDTLLCDLAFDKKGLKEWLLHRGITMIARNMNRTNDHSFLSPIDRMARTLRDMIFTAKRNNPTFIFNEDSLKELCRIYNSSPHGTLSKIMEFKVSPRDVFWYLDLQKEIIRRLYLQNYQIMNSPLYNAVHVGATVYLYKPRQFGEKRRLNVEETPYIVISMDLIIIENTITHDRKSEGIHRKDLVFKY